jgi:uncharacterized protein RhaS with RHS repeats
MYDPTLGRWISQDSLGFAPGDSNLYRYVGNDPTAATDPIGNAAAAAPDPSAGSKVIKSRELTPEEQAEFAKGGFKKQPFTGDAVVIAFDPTKSKKVVCCDEIIHIQVFQVFASSKANEKGKAVSMSEIGREDLQKTEVKDTFATVDQSPGKSKTAVIQETTPPWDKKDSGIVGGPKQVIGYKRKDGSTKTALAVDDPSFTLRKGYDPKTQPNGYKSMMAEFETFPCCRKGLDRGKWYDGGVKWEYSTAWDAKTEGLTSELKITAENLPEPSKNFMAAYNNYTKVTGKDPCKG